jgi:hypothetical protein
VEVHLFTRAGEVVTKVEIPPYKTMPEAILWGQRFFIRREAGGGIYYEGFVHFVIEPMGTSVHER